jgi:hypothetical protein
MRFVAADLRPGGVLNTMWIGTPPPLVLAAMPTATTSRVLELVCGLRRIVCTRSCLLLTSSGLERQRLTLFTDGDLFCERDG